MLETNFWLSDGAEITDPQPTSNGDEANITVSEDGRLGLDGEDSADKGTDSDGEGHILLFLNVKHNTCMTCYSSSRKNGKSLEEGWTWFVFF